MPALRNTVKIHRSPEDVWQVLGDLTAAPEWIPGVVEAKVEGPERVCTTAEGAEIREQIEGYSPRERKFSYVQTEVPLPITGSRGTLRVLGQGTEAEVVWEAEFEPAAGAPENLPQLVEGSYRQALDSLRRRLEDGRG
jgi:Polyketide cyclase / dehydrase and lipid transport